MHIWQLLLQLLHQVENLLLRCRTCLAFLPTSLYLLKFLVVEADALPEALLLGRKAEVEVLGGEGNVLLRRLGESALMGTCIDAYPAGSIVQIR